MAKNFFSNPSLFINFFISSLLELFVNITQFRGRTPKYFFKSSEPIPSTIAKEFFINSFSREISFTKIEGLILLNSRKLSL